MAKRRPTVSVTVNKSSGTYNIRKTKQESLTLADFSQVRGGQNNITYCALQQNAHLVYVISGCVHKLFEAYVNYELFHYEWPCWPHIKYEIVKLVTNF